MGQKQQPQQKGAGNPSNYMKLYEHFSSSKNKKQKVETIENEKQKNKAFYIDILIMVILFIIKF